MDAGRTAGAVDQRPMSSAVLTDRARRRTLVAGLLLAAGYAVPLLVPPHASWPLYPEAGDGVVARLFPGIPAWWIVARLACLFVGTALVAIGVGGRAPLRLGVRARREKIEPPAAAMGWLGGVAVAVILGLVVVSPWVSRLERVGQTIYLLLLAAPAVLFALAEPAETRRSLRVIAARLPSLLPIPALWLAWSIPSAWRTPRAATITDAWMAIERLEAIARGQQGLVDSAIPGLPNTYNVLEGAPLFGPDDLSGIFAVVQVAHFLWPVVCAVGLGLAVWHMIGRQAAIVAEAVLLFSPFMMTAPYSPQPIYIMPLCSAAMLLLLLGIHHRHTLATIAAFGAWAGLSGSVPQHTLPTALACIVVAWWLLRAPSRSWRTICVVTLIGLAAVLPSIPTPETFSKMQQEYTGGRGQYVGMETVLFELRPPTDAVSSLEIGQSRWFDIPLSAALSPFAIVRTPLRGWGDTLFDPVGGALIAIGLLVCLWRVRRNRAVALLLGFLLGGMALAFWSSGDRVSHTRMIGAIVPLVLLAAVGFEAVRRAMRGRARTAWTAGVTATVVLGGLVVSDVVNPSILPASALSVSLEALGDGAVGNPSLVVVPVPFLQTERIVRGLAPRPIDLVDFNGFPPSPLQLDEPGRVWFWPPSLEAFKNLRAELCRLSPGMTLYTLSDAAGLMHTHAAASAGTAWTPALPRTRWAAVPCPGA